MKYADYMIIGAGPGGLQMGYFLAKHQRDYLILEAGDSAGTFFKTFPRHRTMISNNKVHTGITNPETNLRWDWNSLLSEQEDFVFGRYSQKYFPPADTFVQYLNEFASLHQLNIQYKTKVVSVTKEELFHVQDQEGNAYRCKYLIVATGRPLLYMPPIPGKELAETYDTVSTRAEDFTNQRVMIVGKSNSGFETAESMIETAAVIHLTSPHAVKLAWKTHYVGHLRAVNNNFLDTYQLKSQNTIIDAVIDNIERSNGTLEVSISYTHAREQRLKIQVDRVILCTGFRFDSSIFHSSCKPELAIDEKYPALTSEWESTNIKDLYFAGALMHMRDYQKSFSGFIHGFRYNVEALGLIFEKKHHGQDWPCLEIESDAHTLATKVIERANTNSALFQQPGFLCDFISLSRQEQVAHYYKSVPVDYVHESDFSSDTEYFLLTMEYGHKDYADPFNIPRVPDRGDLSAFIHPVIRHFLNNELVAEYHIPEDLENDWSQSMYAQPFQEFMANELH